MDTDKAKTRIADGIGTNTPSINALSAAGSITRNFSNRILKNSSRSSRRLDTDKNKSRNWKNRKQKFKGGISDATPGRFTICE
jgi:hypothetical protein